MFHPFFRAHDASYANRSTRWSSLEMPKPMKSMLGEHILDWCYPKFAADKFIYDFVVPRMSVGPPQHVHLSCMQCSYVWVFSRPSFRSIQHRGSYRRFIELSLQFSLDLTVAKNSCRHSPSILPTLLGFYVECPHRHFGS